MPAHGWVGQGQLQNKWRFFCETKTKTLAEKIETEFETEFPPNPAFRRPALSKKRLDSQNRKIFFSFFKNGRAQIQNKCRENFSVLKRKFLQNLRVEAGGLKIGIGIFRKKSSNFVQKAPQFFKIKVFEVGGLGASRRKVEIFQDFPSVFEIKIQSLLGNSEVRLSEAQSKMKFCKPIFFSCP